MDANNRRIAKNTLLLYVRMLFTMAISLYTSRVVLHVLGVTDYGVYNVVGGVITLLGFLTNSMSGASSRYITFSLGKGDMGEMRRTFGNILSIHFLLAGVVLLLGETVGLWFVLEKLRIPTDRMDAALWVYQLSVLTAMLGVVSVPYNAAIIAHERMGAFAYIGIVDALLKLVIVYLLWVMPYDKLVIYALLLFGVQVFDNSFTYYRVGRTFYGNSGIEVFLSTEPDLANKNGGGWEIMVDCVGNHLANRWEVNQFLGNNYVAFPLEVYSAAFVDGEVNGEATSMGAEVYIPYASLGIEKPDMVYANYAYNRNRDSNNSRDDFCCVGMSEMGASWSDAYKWYQVDENGVKIAKREGVVLEGEGDIGFSVYSGEVSTSVTPAEGYYLTALSVNGVPANENYLTIRNDGSVSYTITDATQDVKVEAKFAKYPETKMTGAVTLTGAVIRAWSVLFLRSSLSVFIVSAGRNSMHQVNMMPYTWPM